MDNSQLMEWARINAKKLVKLLEREIITEEEFYNQIIIEMSYEAECE